MAISFIDDGQRKAARVVGLSYLLAIPPALFAGFYVFSQLIVRDHPAQTVQNVVAHAALFRLGIAANLISFLVDIALIAALYMALAPVHRGLARFAVFVRLIETALFVVVTANFDTLRVLCTADDLRMFEPERLQALARLSIGAYSFGYNVGLVLAGIGSTVFCYLWLRSSYIPKPLAALGIVASVLLASCTFAFIIAPDLAHVIAITYYGGPIFIFELTMGVWLLVKGLPRTPALPAQERSETKTPVDTACSTSDRNSIDSPIHRP